MKGPGASSHPEITNKPNPLALNLAPL